MDLRKLGLDKPFSVNKYSMVAELSQIRAMYELGLVLRPPHFYLLFAFTIIHGGERRMKNGEGLGAFIM